VAELKLFATNAVSPPPLTPEVIAGNEQFWDGFTPQLKSLEGTGQKVENRALQKLEKKLHLEPVVSGQAAWLKEWYAMALNSWGVELQRAGRLEAAGRRFEQAARLDPDNWIARANLFCNTNLLAGKTLGMGDVTGLASQLRSLQSFSLMLGRFGPMDEPSLCYLLGGIYVQSGLIRQGMIQLERAAALAPKVPAPQLALAATYARCGLRDQCLQSIGKAREMMKGSPDYPVVDVELSVLEARVNLSGTNLAASRQVLQALLGRYPGDTKVEGRVFQSYVSFGDLTNAESLVSGMLSQQPDDLGIQMVQSGILIRTGRAAAAIPMLDRILENTNSLPARMNRAIAYLQVSNTAAAKMDLAELQTAGASPFLVNIALAELALREGDTNQAIRNYTTALTNAPAGSVQRQFVQSQIEKLGQPPTK
jgi:predicted Zn-dependent protease